MEDLKVKVEGFEIIEERIKQLNEERLVRVSHAKRNGKLTYSLIRLEKGEGLAEIHMYCLKNDVKYTNHEFAKVRTKQAQQEGKTVIVLWEQIDNHMGRYYEFVLINKGDDEIVVEEQFNRDLNLE